MGDPAFPDVQLNVQVENQPLIISERLSSTKRWITKTILIKVTDGRLTITFDGSWQYAKMCWLKINKN
jgi:hypothetical protein